MSGPGAGHGGDVNDQKCARCAHVRSLVALGTDMSPTLFAISAPWFLQMEVAGNHFVTILQNSQFWSFCTSEQVSTTSFFWSLAPTRANPVL